MSEELKPCPMCGDPLEIVHRNGGKYVRCITCIFETARHGYHVSDGELKRRCNRRPAEDALKAENEELRYIVEQFGMWYNEDGCPKSINHDFPCSAETEYKNDPETEGDFDERDCWKEAHEHGCWVEYYRWKFRQKNNNPDTEKGGENE